MCLLRAQKLPSEGCSYVVYLLNPSFQLLAIPKSIAEWYQYLSALVMSYSQSVYAWTLMAPSLHTYLCNTTYYTCTSTMQWSEQWWPVHGNKKAYNQVSFYKLITWKCSRWWCSHSCSYLILLPYNTITFVAIQTPAMNPPEPTAPTMASRSVTCT